ncbi:imm11 family protein [Cystobacter fuscus]|uniref:imm11 family protein n=1 Tax=Cystobacter fuscus TaxID=43 RepID=UPI0037C03FDE
MERRFFDLWVDVYVPGRWYLAEPATSSGEEIEDPWMFSAGRPVADPGPLRIPIFKPGKPLDIEFAGVGNTPVVNEQIASVFREMAPNDVQLFPVEVEGQADPYYILNVTREIRCIDDAACEEVQYFTQDDVRSDLAGQYRSVIGLRIDTSKVAEARVFRLWGYYHPIIVDVGIKEALERTGISGGRFVEVTGPKAVATGGNLLPETHKNPELLRQVESARKAAFRNLGEPSEESITPIVPHGDAWPSARQAWRIIRRPAGRTLCVSDGLSDPFHGSTEPSCGYGLELAIETDEPVPDDGGWTLLLLRRVSDEVAQHEHLSKALLEGVLSMEVPGKDMPEPLVTRDGRVGVLLGVEATTLPISFPTPAGDVRLVTVKALLPKELAFLLERGKVELLRRLAESGEPHLSRSWRKPVV